MNTFFIHKLNDFEVFNQIKDIRITEFLENQTSKNFIKGQLVMSRASNFAGVIFIKSGLVKICSISTDGKEHILGLGGEGSVFGIESVLGVSFYSKNIYAIKESEVYFLHKDDILNMLGTDKKMLLGFLRELCNDVNNVENRLYSILGKKINEQIAELLLISACNYISQGINKNIVDLDVNEISKIIGTTKNYAQKIIKTFVQKSLIRIEKRSITILNADALRSMAGNSLII